MLNLELYPLSVVVVGDYVKLRSRFERTYYLHHACIQGFVYRTKLNESLYYFCCGLHHRKSFNSVVKLTVIMARLVLVIQKVSIVFSQNNDHGLIVVCLAVCVKVKLRRGSKVMDQLPV